MPKEEYPKPDVVVDNFEKSIIAAFYAFQRKTTIIIGASQGNQPLQMQISKMFERFGVKEIKRWEYTFDPSERKALAIMLENPYAKEK